MDGFDSDYIELAKRLLLKGIPIDGVGLQMHNSMYSPSANQIKECIEKFASLKSIKPSFTVQVTEYLFIIAIVNI